MLRALCLLLTLSGCSAPAPRQLQVPSGVRSQPILGNGVSSNSASGSLGVPVSISVGADGRLYLVDQHAVLRSPASGSSIATVAGQRSAAAFSNPGFPPPALSSPGNGGLATAGTLGANYNAQAGGSQVTMGATAVAADGTIYLADSYSNALRIVNRTSGIISVLLGTGAATCDGSGPAASARVYFPAGIALDGRGGLLYSSKYCHAVMRLSLSAGTVSIVAGTLFSSGDGGDGGAATASGAKLDSPTDVAVDALGNIYIADISNNKVRMVANATGILSTVMGTPAGAAGFGGDVFSAYNTAIPRASSILPGDFRPCDYARWTMAVDAQRGTVYVADCLYNVVRAVARGGAANAPVIFAGDGTWGGSGWSTLSGSATSVKLSSPMGLAVDAAGNVYVADTAAFVVRLLWLPTPTQSPTRSSSATATKSRTASTSKTPTSSRSRSASSASTASRTRSATPTASFSPSQTPSGSNTPSPSPTSTSSVSLGSTSSATETPTSSPSSSATVTASATPSLPPSATASSSSSASRHELLQRHALCSADSKRQHLQLPQRQQAAQHDGDTIGALSDTYAFHHTLSLADALNVVLLNSDADSNDILLENSQLDALQPAHCEWNAIQQPNAL